MATIPTPRTWSPGEILTAPRMNAELRGALAFLLDPPRCHAYDASSLALPNATTTLVTFDSEVYDTDAMHSTSSNTSRVTFTTAGLYEVHYRITLGGGTAITQLDLMARLNAAGAPTGGTSLRTQPFESGGSLKTAELQFRRFFYAGDYIELFATQASGATRNLSALSLGTMVQARWVGVS